MKTVKTVILAMFFLFLLTVTSFGKEGIVTASNLKLRKEPSLDGEVLYGISKDAKVEILEKTDDKWYKVKYNGDVGYVSAEYIKTEETITTPTPVITDEPLEKEEEETVIESTGIEETKTYKASSEIDVYILPIINSSVINKIQPEKQVNIIKKMNKWAYVEAESIYGWVIYNELISETVEVTPQTQTEETAEVTPNITEEPTPEPVVTTTPEPEVTEAPTQTTETIGYINVSTYANLRKDPSTDATILDTLLRNTEVTVVSEENGWSKVKVKGMTGYVSKDLVSSTKLEEIDTTSRGTNETREPEKNVQEPTQVQENSNGVQVVEFAKKYLGYKYVLGGTTPSGGFDCSGFVYYVFGQMGKSISRSLSVQATAGVAVSKANLQIGDIVIFNDSSNSSLGHVGIYVGNSQFIHAANPKRGVVIDYLDSRNSYYNERYVTARRV